MSFYEPTEHIYVRLLHILFYGHNIPEKQSTTN